MLYYAETAAQTLSVIYSYCSISDDDFDLDESSVFEELVSQLSSQNDTMAWAYEKKRVLEELVQEIMAISKINSHDNPCARKTFTALVKHLTRFPARLEDRSAMSPQGTATSLPVLMLLLRRPRYVSSELMMLQTRVLISA